MHSHARTTPYRTALQLCASLRCAHRPQAQPQPLITAMQHFSQRLFSMSARVCAGAAEVAAAKRALAADGIQVLGRVTDEFAEVLTPDAVRFVARLQRRFNSTRLTLLQRRIGQQMLADAGRPLSFPKACIPCLYYTCLLPLYLSSCSTPLLASAPLCRASCTLHSVALRYSTSKSIALLSLAAFLLICLPTALFYALTDQVINNINLLIYLLMCITA